MATQVTLKAGQRNGRGKGAARKLRAGGGLPAVVYGAGADSLALRLDAHDTDLLFRSISVDNTIVNLEVDGEKVPVSTLVREIQTHPVRAQILHVDFLRIQSGVEVELDVPVHLDGIPVGVRDEGGVVEQVVHHVPIRCLPSKIPEEFLVDVSGLAVGDSIHVSDIAIPEGVQILIEDDQTVCSVQVPAELVVETDEVLEGEEEAEDAVDVIGEEESADSDEEGEEAES